MSDSARFYEEVIAPAESRMIRSIWRVTRDAADAEDALQNALLVIWRRRSRIARHPSPQALLLRICIDAARDVVRRRGRHRTRLEAGGPADDPVDASGAPWEAVARRELSDEILNAINGLSRRQAVAITLRVFEELPYEQIAAAMRCGEATARKHVERARGHLRTVLASHEPDHVTRSRP